MNQTRAFVGPLATITALVAVCWLALATWALLGVGNTYGVLLGIVGVVSGILTGWLAWAMRVTWDDEGISLPGRGFEPWGVVDAVSLRKGFLTMPVVGVREGRAILEVPLEGLAWFGAGFPTGVAERIARAAGVEVTTVERGEKAASRGRRAA